ncbi:hypothetical protein Rhopal_006347-T1 [Rhodotorula paludigena]|uniref:Uncharacterized protein n=1 Tax=Rhodotorula paludigena TaxID=86838 RepID=A0AAV5GUX5_9BASI|nr:hypothetical protein Rhopal_006347-T1 [Rhodotorula paludigena]
MPSSPTLATFPPTPALPITRAARSRQSRDEDADAAMYESDDEQGDDQEHLLSSKARLRRPSLGAAASSRFRMMHPIALAGAVVLATSLATLLYRYNPSFHTFATLSASRPGVLVGRRDSAPLYRGCTFDEFLADLKVAKIRDDAPSRDVVDYTPTPTRELPPFRGFSFDLPNCPLPHVFSQAQACDVLSSFGNIAIAGDSFMRHIWDALLLLLQRKSFSSLAPFPTAERQDGAIEVEEWREKCRGEALFNDREIGNMTVLTPCRTSIYQRLERLPQEVCGNKKLRGLYLRSEQGLDMEGYLAYLSQFPSADRQHSPVLYISGGVHSRYNTTATTANFLKPVISLNRLLGPRVVPLWHGSHAPGENINAFYYRTQGRDAVKDYIAQVDAAMRRLDPETDILDGHYRIVPHFNMTEGAFSHDGQHYSYQVNTEKVYIFLTVLDLIWQKAAAAGGLVG